MPQKISFGTDLLWLVDRDGVDLAEESEVIARGFVDLVRGGQPSSQASAQPDR